MTVNPFIDAKGMSRRRILGAALAAGVAVPIGIARPAWASPVTPGSAQLILPAPTGPYPLGTMSLHLIDKSRPDPAADPGSYREMMASVWYPAGNVSRHPLAQWMLPAPMRELLISGEFEPDVAVAPLTAGHEGAPVLCAGERWPVIVFSHGAHDHRSDTTIVVQELASHGYVVVTVDHAYDSFSQFPDGRLTVPQYEYHIYPADFAQDIRFVLDQIEVLAAGRNPDADHRPLPAGLAAALDLRRIGMFGWSKGATATALVMRDDQRVRAGLSFDGPMESDPPITTELNRPFMLMTAAFTRAADPNVAEFWSHLTGWRLNIQAEGAVHPSYCDLQWLLPQVAKATGMTDEELQGWIGTLDPARAVRIQQAYPLAFFDLHLRGRREHLLDGPSPAFPEVKFIG
jgi:predicted dienelactone hydrolase